MNINDAFLFGKWAGEQNNIKKARKIKKVFDKMVVKGFSYSDYDFNVLIKTALERHFDRGYYEI